MSRPQAERRAIRERRRCRAHPMEAHVFTVRFCGPNKQRAGQLAAPIVRGEMGQTGAIAAALHEGPDDCGVIILDGVGRTIQRSWGIRTLAERAQPCRALVN